MVETTYVERSEKYWSADAAVSLHEQQALILLIGQKEDSVVQMEETQVMAAAILLALLSKKREHVFVFEEQRAVADTAPA